jgi:hypothetical protein
MSLQEVVVRTWDEVIRCCQEANSPLAALTGTDFCSNVIRCMCRQLQALSDDNRRAMSTFHDPLERSSEPVLQLTQAPARWVAVDPNETQLPAQSTPAYQGLDYNDCFLKLVRCWHLVHMPALLNTPAG